MREEGVKPPVVGVIDASPVFVLGMREILVASDLDVESADRESAATCADRWDAAVVGLTSQETWQIIGDLQQTKPGLAVVAIVEVDEPRAFVEAVCAGAWAAVWRGSSPADFGTTVVSALGGYAILPIEMFRHVLLLRSFDEGPVLSPEDRLVLRGLAKGQTARDLAKRVDCSERTMHRRLRLLFDRIGARNRAEAIALAARWQHQETS